MTEKIVAQNGVVDNVSTVSFNGSTHATAEPNRRELERETVERAFIATLLNEPRKPARLLLENVESSDFHYKSHRLIIAAAKSCAADKLDIIPANINATIELSAKDTAAANTAADVLQVIELDKYSVETGETALEFVRQLKREFKAKIDDTTTPDAQSAFKLYSFEDLSKIPRLQWLIRGILPESIASALTAKSGDFKSFVALDMALCIATGRAWQGHEVKQGNVIYVAAEGFYTMFDRATAWQLRHDCALPKNFKLIKAPVNMCDTRVVTAFMQSVEAMKPSFIVLDTLSQCAIGMNENDNSAMADFVRGMMAVGNEIGAHVQVLHHNAKATNTFRGGGSFGANIDAHISLDRPENDATNTVFVRCEKQRGKLFEAFALRGDEITLPYTDEYGDAVTALVFEPSGDTVTAKVEKHANSKRAEKIRVELMAVFDKQFDVATEKGFDGVKVGFWREAVEDTPGEPICSAGAFWRHLKALKDSNAIVECGTHNGSPVYRRANSTLTTLSTLNESTESTAIGDSAEYSHNSHIPLGMRVVRVPTDNGRELELPDMPESENTLDNDEPYKAQSTLTTLNESTLTTASELTGEAMSTPVRVQRSRVAGSRLEDSATNGLPIVCVTRGTKWGNTFTKEPGETDNRRVVEAFEKSLNAEKVAEIRRELRGKNLACWCQPNAICHADVLLKIANGELVGGDGGV